MFSEIVGHDRIKLQLQKDIEMQSFHQSYLFSGTEHVGKMSLLRSFITQVREGRSFDMNTPFGAQILSGRGHGLLSFLDDGESFKVEQVRSIIDFVSRRTADDQISFCVIEHIERMTRSASNAFLKILEEPSDRMVYMMTVRSEHKLLPTILSRVQIYRFGVIPSSQVESYLHRFVHNEITCQEIMKLSSGRIGLAVSLMEDKDLLQRLRKLYDFSMLLFEKDIVDRFTLVNSLLQEDVSHMELEQFLMYFAIKLRQEGIVRHLSSLDKIQQIKRWFSDTQVNKKMHLEELFLF